MNIIKRNFLRLLRLGAFGENEVIEPMSKFKWEVIFHIANIHNVVGVIFDGIAKNKENEALIPQDIILKYKKILDEEGYGIKSQATGSRPSVQLPDAGLSHMCNGFLNARL